VIAYAETRINLRDIRGEDEAIAIERTAAALRVFFTREHPDKRTLPYIVAHRLNVERQQIDVRVCAPADEVLERLAGNAEWNMKQFMVAP
jgi:hypothetical protein